MNIKITHSLATLIFILILAGCNSSAQSPQPVPTTAVRTADVIHEARSLPIRTSGRLAPKAEIDLSFKTDGLIRQFLVDEGQAVRAGQLLAQLDLSEIEAQVQQAESALEKSARDAERVAALHRDSVATLEQLQDSRTAVSMARSALTIAAFNRQHSEICAPADGRIMRRLAEANELVTPGEAVLVLGAAQGWVVRVGLPDRDVVKLHLGDEATLHFDAYPGQSFTGRVTEIAEAADPTSGTFEVEISVVDAEGLLKSGFIARVDLYPATGDSLYFIPAEALVEGNGRDGIVYAIDESSTTARRIPVRIAHLLNDEVAIAEGLEDVRQVVTAGAAYLADGAQVQIVR